MWNTGKKGIRVLRQDGIDGLLSRLRTRFAFWYWRVHPSSNNESYDSDFIDEHRPANAYAANFAGWVARKYAPTRVLDVGCGDCSLLLAFAQYGIIAIGLDGSSTAVHNAPQTVLVFRADLNRPFMLNGLFPLVSCIEVAEHLSPRAGGILVSSLVQHAGNTIVFSAAHPGQGGFRHINERPKQYWLDLFFAKNWIEDSSQTKEALAVLQYAQAPDYLMNNLVILHPRKSFQDRNLDMGFG